VQQASGAKTKHHHRGHREHKEGKGKKEKKAGGYSLAFLFYLEAPCPLW
jgi:hypothetical protein